MEEIEFIPAPEYDNEPERRHIRCPILVKDVEDGSAPSTKVYVVVSYEGKILEIECPHYRKILNRCDHPANTRFDRACIAFSG